MRGSIPLAGVLLLGSPGCESKEPEQPELMVSVPLDFDPTEAYEVATWWSNDQQLLYLGDDGFYRLYAGTNRYRPPAERGQWWKQHYAAMWLEPYEQQRHQNRRVAVAKVEGVLTLTIGSLAPMTAITAPPVVLEDRLIGDWSGAAGKLLLDEDLRYVFLPRTVLPEAPAAVARHEGSWRVDGDLLTLEPDSPSAPPMVFGLQNTLDGIVLMSGDDEFRQIYAGAG